MIQLKIDVMECIDTLNTHWTDAIKKGEEDGIDLTEMFSKFTAETKKLDEKFNQAMLRVRKAKGRF